MFQIYGQRSKFVRVWGVVGEAATPTEAALMFVFLWDTDHHRLELWKDGKPDHTASLEAYRVVAKCFPEQCYLPPETLFSGIWKTNRAKCESYLTIRQLAGRRGMEKGNALKGKWPSVAEIGNLPVLLTLKRPSDQYDIASVLL